MVDGAVVGEAAFAEPAVVADAELLEIVADVGEDVAEGEVERLPETVCAEERPGPLDHGVDVQVLVARRRVRREVGENGGCGAHQGTSRALDELVGDRAEVIAAIAVARERELFAEAFEVAQPDARREDIHLPAGVVDVVLAMHAEAGGVEQVGERCAERSVATVADVQRTRRIRRDELDDDALARAELAPAIRAALVDDARQFGLAGRGREEEIDEAGSRDFDARNQVVCRQCCDDRLCKVTRLALAPPWRAVDATFDAKSP